MAPWGWIAAAYGAWLALAALGLRGVGRRDVAAVAAIAYALLAVALASLAASLWIQLVVPGALLVTGYWLSGFFFRDPQRWLERWLIESDRRVFRAARLHERLIAAPRWCLELLEASYTADYIVVAAGALITAAYGVNAVSRYWTLVLAAELACYAALPVLRSRPPRALEPPGAMAQRGLLLRRFNVGILDRASVQANTLPSGHVAGALAAALAVMPLNPAAGAILLVVAVLIGLSAVAGRYHYVADCVLGAGVAAGAWLVLAVSTS